jgi:hypothetical protein
MVRSAQINLFLPLGRLKDQRVCTRRLPSESHCQRACFEGTKKPIGGLLASIDILSLDRHAEWRPAKLVRHPPSGQEFL